MEEGQREKGTWAEEGEFMACWGEDWGGKLVKDLLRHHAKHLELGSGWQQCYLLSKVT